MHALKGKTIAVIGGTSGIGRRVAELALDEGAIVTVGGRNRERLDESNASLAAISETIDAHAVHASDTENLHAFFEDTGRLDHLISTVGGAMGGGFASNSIEDIESAFQHKVFDNLRIAHIARPYLNEGGSLTFTGGAGGRPHTASGAFLGNSGLLTMVQA
jgi:NAD(P)-dependent dehydrogenase (short-subunit alcohol dehydrogenase family)